MKLLDLLYPNYCYGCKALNSSNKFLCFACWKDMPLIRANICFQCGSPLAFACNKKCLHCRNEKFYFQEARCAGRYSAQLRQFILDLKLREKFALHYFLGSLIVWQINQIPFAQNNDCVTAVPVSRKSYFNRGFNQAEILGKFVARKLRLPFRKMLKKVKDIPSQTSLNKTERMRNVAGAFVPIRKIKSHNVLLIDDVFTSGSTLSECAKMLRESGAASVRVATIARTTESVALVM